MAKLKEGNYILLDISKKQFIALHILSTGRLTLCKKKTFDTINVLIK